MEENESGPLDSKSLTALSTSSGEEANRDLSLKIVEISRKNETTIEKVSIIENGEKVEIIEKGEAVVEAVELLDPNTVDITDNIVLRKLLRGSRYFNPPDSGWETCYNCGEEGHMAVNCKSASQRKKACFVCGSLDHGARQCSKAQDCFICKKSGHRAKDCPDKYKSSSMHGQICLRCGVSGHDMFSCRNDYSHDDIKEIQCYICKRFGHLCCVYFVDTGVREVSCYRCGQLGHTGLSCGRSRGETKETTYNELPSLCYKCGEGGHFASECAIGFASSSLCYKCGEGGHFARECTIGTPSSSLCYKCGEGGHFARKCSFGKVGKRTRESSSSTPNVRPRRGNKDFLGYKSAPHDNAKSRRKRKRIQFEEKGLSTPRKEKKRGFSTPRKVKKRSGWITEDPVDFSNRKSTSNHWNSPSTPSNQGRKKSSLNSGGQISGSRSSKSKNSRRYSASRRTNNWW